MKEPFGSQPEKRKADGVTDALNRLLQNLVLKCAKADGIRDFFHVGMISYGGKVASGFGGMTYARNNRSCVTLVFGAEA